MRLALRQVEEKDIDLLFGWANEPTVRQNSFCTEPISYENHQAWFVRMLADKDVENYILYDADEEKELGQIRFNIEEGVALIDYSVDVARRGQGMGARMLLLAEEIIRSRQDVDCLKAEVKHENGASAKVFEKCGYEKHEKEQFLEFTKYIRG